MNVNLDAILGAFRRAFAWLRAESMRMMGRFRLLERFTPTRPPTTPEKTITPVRKSRSTAAKNLIQDDTLIYAVGDIHGRADLLEKLLQKIETDCENFAGEVHLVFLGDYIDRGLQSRQVIDILVSDQLARFTTHFLKGNHEDALLTFLSDPGFGPKWASYGGRETLVSYGVKPPRSLSRNLEWNTAHDDFLQSISNRHQTFFRSLQTSLQIGGFGFAHAGLKPGKNFAEQDDADLMWIRDEFLKADAPFDVMVVHGHTPVEVAHHDHRRINVDTGAYFTGRLTAVKLTSESVSFIDTGA